MSGYLVLKPSSQTSASFRSAAGKRWFALLPDFVLYTYRTEGDAFALTATPMPGYTVLYGNELKGDGSVSEKDRDKIIKMVFLPSAFVGGHGGLQVGGAQSGYRKAYYFAGTQPEEVER